MRRCSRNFRYLLVGLLSLLFFVQVLFLFNTSFNIETVKGATTPSFFSVSNSITTINGNPTQQHAFQPVHSDAIQQVDKSINGVVYKYLAYDCDPEGSQIRLF